MLFNCPAWDTNFTSHSERSDNSFFQQPVNGLRMNIPPSRERTDCVHLTHYSMLDPALVLHVLHKRFCGPSETKILEQAIQLRFTEGWRGISTNPRLLRSHMARRIELLDNLGIFSLITSNTLANGPMRVSCAWASWMMSSSSSV